MTSRALFALHNLSSTVAFIGACGFFLCGLVGASDETADYAVLAVQWSFVSGVAALGFSLLSWITEKLAERAQ